MALTPLEARTTVLDIKHVEEEIDNAIRAHFKIGMSRVAVSTDRTPLDIKTVQGVFAREKIRQIYEAAGWVVRIADAPDGITTTIYLHPRD